MFKIFGIIMFSLLMNGCATHSEYGNFIAKNENINQEKIAEDTIKQIVKLYPPAKTQFEIKQITPDFFGGFLVNGLRNRGYALQEFALEDKGETKRASNGLPLYYILDKFSGTNMYRVTVIIGNQSLTRPYSQEADGLMPLGSWIRKE